MEKIAEWFKLKLNLKNCWLQGCIRMVQTGQHSSVKKIHLYCLVGLDNKGNIIYPTIWFKNKNFNGYCEEIEILDINYNEDFFFKKFGGRKIIKRNLSDYDIKISNEKIPSDILELEMDLLAK